MFIISTVKKGDKLIISFCGNFQPKNQKKNQFVQTPESFNEDCRRRQYSDHDYQIDRAFEKSKFQGVKEVIITRHRKCKINFNGQAKKVATKIRGLLPDGIKTEIKILELQKYLGQITNGDQVDKYESDFNKISVDSE